MKKILLSILMIILLSACNQAPTPVEDLEETTKIEISSTSPSTKQLNKYEGCVYDFDADGDDETILLLTDANKDENGEYMWDDSHHWVLLAEDTDGVYTLYDNYLHGTLNLNVSEGYDENNAPFPIIRLTISSSAAFSINEYRYSDNSFIMKNVYDTGSINELSIEKY